MADETKPAKCFMHLAEPVHEISNLLNNVVVVKKGLIDVISNGNTTAFVGTKASMKRCGG
jgi:hypothetical protein